MLLTDGPTPAAAVLARYPLDAPVVQHVFDASTRNDNYLVRDAHGESYVLRRYRRNRDIRRVEFQIRLQQFLVDRGYPVPQLVPTREGRLLVSDLDAPWVLFQYVEGEHFDFERPEQAAEAGRRLGEFHLLTECFDEPAPEHEIQLITRSYWTDGESEIALLEKRFGSAAIAKEVRYLRTWLDELRRALPLDGYDALPAGWLHDDYHGRNLVFHGNHVVALLDFDRIEHGAYVLDIERGLHSFGRERRGSHVVRDEWARRFLEGYETVRPLTSAERVAVPVVYGIHLAGPSDAIYGMLESDGEHALDEFREDVENLRRRREEAEAIARLLSGG